MQVLLEMVKITKKYGDFVANDQIHFSLKKGEIHAIVGENGAGKTTLMRMLYGMEKITSGNLLIHGKEVDFNSPADAINQGIGMVHQHFMLFPSFSVMENIVIGHEPANGTFFHRMEAKAKVKQLSETYRMPIDPDRRIAECPVGIQQRAEILKVLYHGADIIILDEPTAVLTPLEIKELLSSIKHLAKQGKSIILITHKLGEVLEVADRITVLRQGKVTGTLNAVDTSVEELSRLMVGRDIIGVQRTDQRRGDVVLNVERLFLRGNKGKPALDHVSFQVHAGEIVGVAGVSGNGQSELIQVISGLTHTDSGKVVLMDQDISSHSVNEIRRIGLAHIPEDRYQWGSAKEATVEENGMMGHYKNDADMKGKAGLLNKTRISSIIKEWVKAYSIKTKSIREKAQNLSGGNLQKLIVAREMEHRTPFLIAAEPTRGVDIGAMEFIHGQLMHKRDQGDGILLVSSELSEILALSDRVLIMYEGKIIGELIGKDATEEKISYLMAGGES